MSDAPGGHDRRDSNGKNQIDTLGRIFSVLSNKNRRNILLILTEYSNAIQISKLSSQVSKHSDMPIEDLELSLSQFHLPEMERVGLVEFNRSDSTTEITETGETAVDVIEFANDSFELSERN